MTNTKIVAETICDAFYKTYPHVGPCHRFSSEEPCTYENCLSMQIAYALGNQHYTLVKETEEYIELPNSQ